MKQPKRFVVASDNHGDQCDATSVAALWRFIDDFQPQIRIHAGDCFDLRPLRKNADADEKQERIASDVEAGLAFLNRFFDGGSERVFLRGNHDERLWESAESHKGNERVPPARERLRQQHIWPRPLHRVGSCPANGRSRGSINWLSLSR